MRPTILLLIAVLAIKFDANGKSTKTILCNPDFKFEYNPSVFDVWSSKNSTFLTEEKSVDELSVRVKGKSQGSLKITTNLAYDKNLLFRRKTSPGINYDDFISNRPYYIPTTDYELSKELITVNGLTFTVKRFLVESCGIAGKSSNYYYSIYLDTTFHNYSKLKVNFISYYVDEKKLPQTRQNALNLISFFQGFGYTTTAAILQGSFPATTQEIQQRYESEVVDRLKSFRRRSIKAYEHDTTGYTTYDHYAGLIAIETIQNYGRTDQLEKLADTIVAVRSKYANRELKTFLDTYQRYNYSTERLYTFHSKLSKNQFPYDYYLNVPDEGAHENSLDTLFKLTLLHDADIDAVFYHWNSSPAGLYYPADISPLDTNNSQIPLLGNRPYEHFVPELIRKIYAEELKSTDPNFQPYLELINSADIKTYLLFNPARYHQSELLLATFRNNDAHWKLEIDTLDKSLRLRGKERLREFGDYYLFEQRDSIYLLDCRTSPVTMTSLPFTGDSLDQYTFYSKEIAFNKHGGFIEPTTCNFQRDQVDEAIIDRMWNQLVRDKKIIVDNEYNPCYTCINLNHGDSLVPPLAYYTYARMSVSPEQVCYRSGYQIRDLDTDGKDELFCYTVSNG
ncbi:MAG: hypothetical protein ACKVOK_06210, partial [Flavobacteriales bacterium]